MVTRVVTRFPVISIIVVGAPMIAATVFYFQIETGAALIMVAVFGAFAAGKTTVNQQVGFGLSVAVLLDATLVRSVLVPASMEVLGKRNWYLPRFLRWLPDLRVEPAEESSVPGADTKP